MKDALCDVPVVHDSQYQLALFAENPQIVTPIGMAIDSEDQLLVIESHTHSPPADYSGPKYDRILRLADTDGDGRCDREQVFAEGFEAAMNLTIGPDRTVFVVCAREVFALRDTDGDGKCDQQQKLVELITDETYPHNCLLSIALSTRGHLYIGRGNTASRHYRLRGSDGSEVEGYGDGGSILRCRADGSHVEEFATGFWNPFDLEFDRQGRLICVDNDPDARGPNRVVHVVRQGDYGYRSLYGGAGTHPFQGWSGDLPGVLPIAGATGEAPSGILVGDRSSLPPELAGNLLITIWNENSIEKHRVEETGLSFRTLSSPFLTGGKDFRPVAIDCDSQGNIYITDWVLVDYPNHGRGRIWKLTPQQELEGASNQLASPESEVDNSVFQFPSLGNPAELTPALRDDDKFRQHAAVLALTEGARSELLDQLQASDDPRLRLGALLAYRKRGGAQAIAHAQRFLRDPDAVVRQAALIWIGEEMFVELRDQLSSALEPTNTTGVLLDTYFAAWQNLDPAFVEAYRSKATSKSNQLSRSLDEDVVISIVEQEALPSVVRAEAVRQLSHPEESLDLLEGLLEEDDVDLQTACIRALGRTASARALSILRDLIAHESSSPTIRVEAVIALGNSLSQVTDLLVALLDDDSPEVRLEAARGLRGVPLSKSRRKYVLAALERYSNKPRFVEQCQILLGQQGEDRPKSLADWEKLLSDGGDARIGSRVWRTSHVRCQQCHTIHGRGATLGPALGNVGLSKSRRQIIRSILYPSEEFSPEYQAWQVVTIGGQVITGLQLDHKARGAIEIITDEGKKVRIEGADVDDYYASPKSIMPEDLQASLGTQELRDLVAYLSAGNSDAD